MINKTKFRNIKYFLFSLFLIFSVVSYGQYKLSNKAEISLLTCEKGYELYSAYGHSSIRVYDKEIGLDVVFNYGTFEVDANEIVFLGKFIKGVLDYTLSTEPYTGKYGFYETYKRDNRGITEQIFDLTLQEKQAILDRLIINYETEERFYRYDFFYDNCSSRIHEILKEVLGEELNYGNDLHEESPQTFRVLIDPAFDFSPWADFGVGIIMGFPTDKVATNYQKMFLPVHMMERFENATFKGKPFIKSTKILFRTIPPIINIKVIKTPIFIFSLLLFIVLAITYRNFKLKKHWYSLDYVLFFVTGLIGIFFLFMWFGTRHSPTHLNFNMFWAMPLNLIMIFFLKNVKIKYYLLFMVGINIFGYIIFPQVFHEAIIPIGLMMAIRYMKNYNYLCGSKG